MLKAIRAAVLLLIALYGGSAFAQNNIQIYPTGPVYRLSGLVWGTSTTPGFNNNYFFTPLNLNESVCVYVKNNNPSNSHTFTASILINSDPGNITPTDATWQSAATVSGLFTGASPGIPAAIAAPVSGVAQVSVNLSASATQSGSPDTANVTIIQTTGSCFSGNSIVTSSPTTVSSVLPLQVFSDGLTSAFYAANTVVSPTAGAVIGHVNDNSSSKSIYLDSAIVSCTVACTVNVAGTTNLGTSCSTMTPSNAKINSSQTSTALFNYVCGTAPTILSSALLYTLDLPANSTAMFDLKGVILLSGSNNGIAVFNSNANAGNMRVSFRWYEK